jgi:hypothetical protein
VPGRRQTALAALAVAALTVATAGAAPAAHALATWTVAIPQPGALDVTTPRSDGRMVVAAAGTLSLLQGTTLSPFARGPGGYTSSAGEPYIALSKHRRVRSARCAFARDDVFAIEPGDNPSVIRITAAGKAQPFASLMPGLFLAGLGFDTVGDYGYRLLVAATSGSDTSLIAIDCRGRAKVLAQTPSTHVEGGMAVAPRSFGRLGGRFVAADEDGGDLITFDRKGGAHTLVASGLPKGGDIGVESVGFIPERGPGSALALLADRGGQAEPHPGDDAILGVTVGDLLRAGARRGDLLAATEGGAQTIAVRCPRTCHVRHVADGPATAHAEGHIVFADSR